LPDLYVYISGLRFQIETESSLEIKHKWHQSLLITGKMYSESKYRSKNKYSNTIIVEYNMVRSITKGKRKHALCITMHFAETSG